MTQNKRQNTRVLGDVYHRRIGVGYNNALKNISSILRLSWNYVACCYWGMVVSNVTMKSRIGLRKHKIVAYDKGTTISLIS